MQLASAGYLVASPNFYDGTATEARDKNGTQIQFSHVNRGEYRQKDGSPHPEAYKQL